MKKTFKVSQIRDLLNQVYNEKITFSRFVEILNEQASFLKVESVEKQSSIDEKQKAKELVEKFYNSLPQWVNYEDARNCALICVDENIEYAKTFGDVTDLDIEKFERIKIEIQNYEP